MRKCVHLDGKLILREFFDIQKLDAYKLAIYEIMKCGNPRRTCFEGRSQRGVPWWKGKMTLRSYEKLKQHQPSHRI
jgi:hypothetical protein